MTPAFKEQCDGERVERVLKSGEKVQGVLRSVALTYAKPIIEYLLLRQKQYNVSAVKLKKTQSQVTPKNRQILLEWIMEVSEKFQLKR